MLTPPGTLHRPPPRAVRVFLTVDTEVWPLAATKAVPVAADFDRDYYGITSEGEFGAVYQAEVLQQHGLRGVFFVEALSSYVTGDSPLAALLPRLLERGHEVGLHLHAEWCRRDPGIVGGSSGGLMRHYSADLQAVLISKGLERLQAAGAGPVRSFRAGGYAANLDTLDALARTGIRFDSSHNACWMGVTCEIRTPQPLWQPQQIRGVYEYPVTVFEDWPRHSRHAEICACSSTELEHMLLQAYAKQWHAVVIVSHSFELIHRRPPRPTPNPIVVRRFQRLCRFLASRPDQFLTSTFHDDGLDALPPPAAAGPLTGRLRNTFWRHVEQACKRIA